MKVSVIGMGRVGSAVAFSVISHGLAEELVLVSRDVRRAKGDALDLQHAASFVRRTQVRAGELSEAAGSDVIILAASAAPSMAGFAGDRLAMAEPNANLMRALVPPLVAGSPRAVFIVITNPTEVMTYAVLKISGLPAAQVMGTGTLVDTARLRSSLSMEVGIHANDIRAYILGEHGESQFAAFSGARAGGAPLGIPPARAMELADEARTAGHRVVQKKGHSNYAVAAAATLLLDAVAHNAKIVAPVSTLIDGYLGVHDVCLSVPAVIGRAGVLRTLPVELDADEMIAFRRSADIVRQTIQSLGALG